MFNVSALASNGVSSTLVSGTNTLPSGPLAPGSLGSSGLNSGSLGSSGSPVVNGIQNLANSLPAPSDTKVFKWDGSDDTGLQSSAAGTWTDHLPLLAGYPSASTFSLDNAATYAYDASNYFPTNGNLANPGPSMYGLPPTDPFQRTDGLMLGSSNDDKDDSPDKNGSKAEDEDEGADEMEEDGEDDGTGKRKKRKRRVLFTKAQTYELERRFRSQRYKTKKTLQEKGINPSILSGNAFTSPSSTAFAARSFRMPMTLPVLSKDLTSSSYQAAAAAAFQSTTGYLQGSTGYLPSASYLSQAPPTTTSYMNMNMGNGWW